VTLVYASRRTGNSTAKPRRATGPQMRGEENLAAKRARTALLLVKALGITVADAVTRTNSNSAMRVAFKAASPAERIAFFRSDVVKSFIITAGLMTPEEHLKAAVDALGVEGALNLLATIDATAVAAA